MVRQGSSGATRLEPLQSAFKKLTIGPRRRQILADVLERSSDQSCGPSRRKLFGIRRRKHRFENSLHVTGFGRRENVRLIIEKRTYASCKQFALHVL